MNRSWLFVDSGQHDGQWNMRCDEHCALELLSGEGTSLLRIYRWSPWAISLGHHQSDSGIDRKKCSDHGIGVVRRPTGGRAILHAEELTYSIVMMSEGRSIHHIYREISLALVRGLKLFGIQVSLQQSQPDLKEQHFAQSFIPCFASSARHEIEYEGRKIVGSAQHRYRQDGREVVLQHGSILTGGAHKLLPEFLTLDRTTRLQMMDSLERKTTDLASIQGSPVDVNRLSTCIKSGFEMEWGITFSPHHSLPKEPVYAAS